MTRPQSNFYRRLGKYCCCLVALPLAARADVSEQVRSCAGALFRERVTAIAPAGADIDRILQPALWIEQAENTSLRALPFQLYEVQYTLVRPSLIAYLLADETRCQLVAGDLSELLGENMDSKRKRRFALESLNSLLRQKRNTTPTEEETLLRYAYGAATVLYFDDQIEILEDVASLRRIVNAAPIGPDDPGEAVARSTRAMDTYEAPRIRRERGAQVAEFVSWTGFGGALRRHQVSVRPDGTIQEHSQILMREVGRYRRVRYRM